ncbi:MAG: hypothetical protein COA42_13725 [Alteromonadaceae bacterium]|nr:MAG: hypothetical protein COA42_13725 [Alteromonadaceae bacterium]
MKNSTIQRAVLCLSIMMVLAINYYLYARSNDLPNIQGVFLSPALKIAPFELVDHQGNRFTNSDLEGDWHLLAYGYTYCPDYCPNVLDKLHRVSKMLVEAGQFTNLQVIFYSIDPINDTAERMAEYTSYFNHDFIGLTSDVSLSEGASSFERSLGIVSAKSESGGFSHGVFIYLINADGELQAVFKPEAESGELAYFSKRQVFRDYMAIRTYFM